MQIVLVINNVRSIHNVGSLLRTAECLGVDEVYICGYSPYPKIQSDTRLPHVIAKTQAQLHKTALGAEEMLTIHRFESFEAAVRQLHAQEFKIVAVEQAQQSVSMPAFKPEQDVALVVGNEVDGLDNAEIDLCDMTVEIPMHGKKESLNVVQAAAIALYQTKFFNHMVK